MYKQKYKEIVNSDTVVCCFDHEQIRMTPHIFESWLLFKRMLNSFKLTVNDLYSSDGFCYLWSESVAKKCMRNGILYLPFYDIKIRQWCENFCVFQ